MGVLPADRLMQLESRPDLVSQRDDLAVELVTLLNQTGQPKKALEMLSTRRFNPWEGGEGLVSGQYVWAHLMLGRSFLESGDQEKALTHFSNAREYPHNLGEGKHLLTPEAHLDYFSGVALSQMGRTEEARQFWTRAAADERPLDWTAYYRALSFQALDRHDEASRILNEMRLFAAEQMKAKVKVDYFATSLPNLLLFEDDLQKRNQVDCLFLLALAELGQRNIDRASTLLKELVSLDGNQLAAQQELQALTRRTGREEAIVGQ